MPKPNHQPLTPLPESPRPHPAGQDIISAGTEYFRISKAADILSCAVPDLLHLGATGRAEIMAPVVLPGSFEWPFGSDGIPFPEIEEPFRVTFGAADRVILSAHDLSRIEAVGWTIPNFFYAPSTARRLVEDAAIWQGALKPLKIQARNSDGQPIGEPVDAWTSSGVAPNPGLNNEMAYVRERSLHSRWHTTGSIIQSDGDLENGNSYQEPSYAPEIVTTVEHLFISKAELQRLLNGLPQDEIATQRGTHDHQSSVDKNIGHLDRHASRREPMWRAAIYCLGTMLGPKLDMEDLITQIELKAQNAWPDEEPLQKKGMQSYLTRTLSGDMSKP